MEEKSTLQKLFEKLKTEVLAGRFFWRQHPPREYSSGMLFKGLNFALLGLNSFNELENRWITEGERMKNNFILKNDCGPAQRILIFTSSDPDFAAAELEPGIDTKILSIECWNTTQILNGLPSPHEPNRQLSDMLPLIKIPYISTSGIGYFDVKQKLKSKDPKKDKLGINPLELLRQLCYQKLPEIRTSIDEDCVPGSTDQIFEDLTVELASCRIAATLDCVINIDEFANHIRKAFEKMNVSSATEQLKLVRAFADASVLEEKLLTEEHVPLPLKDYEVMEPFVSQTEWRQIILSDTNTAAYTLIIENLLQNASDCKIATDNNTAYLRYLCSLPEQEIEFYATSVTNDGDISGILKTKEGNLPIVLAPESLHNTFTLEITHKPVLVPQLK